MGKDRQAVIILFGAWVIAQTLWSIPTAAQLSPLFYQDSCPNLLPITASIVRSAIQNESRIAASLLRLHFHDCFVQGCDGSILLDGNNTEKLFLPNLNSVRGFGVIDEIKAAVESSCPNVVSCADIVALASFFSVVMSGAPAWAIPLGRRDSLAPAPSALQTNLPAPTFNISQLKATFGLQNLTSTDLVALAGGHTIGLARCVIIEGRLFPADPNLNTTLLASLRTICPQNGDGNVTVPMDLQTPVIFDNLYYQNILNDNGLFNSDMNLTVDTDTNTLVNTYATNQSQFFADFVAGMIKMGNLNPLTGTQGEIRQVCNVSNPTQNIIDEVVPSKSMATSEELSPEAEDLSNVLIQNVVKEVIGSEFGQMVEKVARDGMQSSK